MGELGGGWNQRRRTGPTRSKKRGEYLAEREETRPDQ